MASNNSDATSNATEQTQQSPTAFTTTDASGYPDKRDGLSAHTTQNILQDPHEHHKYNQVQDPSAHTHDHGHIQSQDPAHSHNSQIHNTQAHQGHHEESMIGKSPVEVAEMLHVHDAELPLRSAVPGFLR